MSRKQNVSVFDWSYNPIMYYLVLICLVPLVESLFFHYLMYMSLISKNSGLAFSGVDYSRYKDSDLVYDIANMKQETIVNRGKQSHCGIYSSLSCNQEKYGSLIFLTTIFTVGLKDLVTSAFVNKHNNHSRATLSKL